MTLFNLLKRYNPSLDTLPQFANCQGVGALLYEEVAGSGENPFDTIGLMRLSQYSQKQSKKWFVQKENIGRLSRFCEQHGLKMLIFKGYAMSQLYDKPESRKSGDVDVFFFDKDFNCASLKVDELIKEKGKDAELGDKHSSFDIRETHIENHRHFVGSEEHPRLEVAEEYLLKQINDNYNDNENCHPGDVMVKSTEWSNVYYPSPNFNAVLLPLHMGEHFVNEGSSLRQLIDWVVFLKKCEDKVDWPKVYALADQCGYRKWLDVLNGIASDYFDVPCSKFKISNVQEVSKEFHDQEEKILSDLINSKPYDREAREHSPLKYMWNRTLMTFRDAWKIRMVYDENPLKWYFRHGWGYMKSEE